MATYEFKCLKCVKEYSVIADEHSDIENFPCPFCGELEAKNRMCIAQKIAAKNRVYIVTEKTKQKISNSLKGRKYPDKNKRSF
jgi:DNA-directed RNA polymerase subunit RPC12/RpoP